MSPRNIDQNEKMRTETLEKITRLSLRVFSEYGFHGTTMKKISQGTGISHGLIYHYFKSKEDLFFHLVKLALEKSNETLNRGLSIEGNPLEKIENLSKTLFQELVTGESHQYFFIIIQAMTQAKGIPGILDYIKTHSITHYSQIIPLIIEGQQMELIKSDDPMSLAIAYFSFFQGLSLLVFQEETMLEEQAKSISPDFLTNILKK